MVTRTWTITASDPRTLVATISLSNANTAQVATTLIEPIPTDIQRIKYRPAKVLAGSANGLARFDVSIPPGSHLNISYTALLTRVPKANASDRLAAVQVELQTSLDAAQPTDADRAIAATMEIYLGTVAVTEKTADGVVLDGSNPGDTSTTELQLTTTLYCRVVSRGCGFPAHDYFSPALASYTNNPVLTALEPSGLNLVSNASTDQPGTCGDAAATAVGVRSWTVEPRAWELSWTGWEVSAVQYTVVDDFTVPSVAPCRGGSAHIVSTGVRTH